MSENIEHQMREVLVALGMTGAGRTTSVDASRSTTPDWSLVDDRGRGRLTPGDAPHLEFALRWDAAGNDDERLAVLEAARSELDAIRRSRANPAANESKKDRDARIVRDGEGWAAREVAISFRTGIKDVWAARRAAGRELEYGQRPRDGRELSRDERRAEILRLRGAGLHPTAIADSLQLPRSTVRYVLARAAK